jgi:hypothetical protein
MTIAEHKLNLIRQINELPEQSLIELEKIIMQLKANHAIQIVRRKSGATNRQYGYMGKLNSRVSSSSIISANFNAPLS